MHHQVMRLMGGLEGNKTKDERDVYKNNDNLSLDKQKLQLSI